MSDARPNPTPPEWQELPPDTPYACPGEAHVGDTVPGRAGGTVVGCATPSKAHPREGQYRYDRLGPGGRNVRKSRVRKSLHRTAGGTRKRGVCRHRRDALLSAADLDQALHTPSPLPYAVELEFPHEPGSSTSCVLHPKWRAFESATNDARAYLEERDGDESPALEDVAAEVKRAEPALWKWAVQAHKRGLGQWEQRVASRALVTGADSDERVRGRRASEARRRGVEMTGKRYRDDVLHGREAVSSVQNPSARELAVRGAAGARTLARRASPHVKAAARATGRAVVRGAKWAAPRARDLAVRGAKATGRATVRAAKATGRAIKRGSKRAAPHVARGLKGAAARLERWAAANPSRFYWLSGGYRCGHKHPSVKAAVSCALKHVAQGDVKVMRW